MKKSIKKLFLSLLLVSLVLSSIPLQASRMSSNVNIPYTKSQCKLQKEAQKLWIDHVIWTRSYATSAIASLPDQNDVLQRLLKNQDDIGDSVKPYYGEEAGNKLTALLREHIALAGQVLNATKNNNKSELDKYNKLWHENADQIAEFLSSANPNYSLNDLKDMLYQHLEHLTDQFVARLNNNWQADIDAYDKGEEHMIHFANILADGIIKQFPEKFK